MHVENVLSGMYMMWKFSFAVPLVEQAFVYVVNKNKLFTNSSLT